MKNYKTIWVSAILILLSMSSSHAALILNATGLQATDVVSTSNFGSTYTVDRTIDQSDLNQSYVSEITSTSIIDNISLVNQGNGWHGALNDAAGSITFDFGKLFDFDRIYLFWMNSGGNNNIADFDVQISNDSSFINFVTAASFSGTPSAPQQRVNFASIASGRFIRLSWNSLQGSYPGLNEFIAGGIASEDSVSVPTPATLGLFAFSLLWIRKQRKS